MAACLARQPGDGRAGAARLPACLPPALACPRTRDPRGGSSCGPQLDGEPLLITHVHHTPACLPHRAPDVMTGWMEMIVRDAGGRAWQRSSLCPAILISGDDRYVEVGCARVMAGNRGADGVPRTASACTSTTGCAVQHGGPALRRNGTGALHHRHHHQQPACRPARNGNSRILSLHLVHIGFSVRAQTQNVRVVCWTTAQKCERAGRRARAGWANAAACALPPALGVILV